MKAIGRFIWEEFHSTVLMSFVKIIPSFNFHSHNLFDKRTDRKIYGFFVHQTRKIDFSKYINATI